VNINDPHLPELRIPQTNLGFLYIPSATLLRRPAIKDFRYNSMPSRLDLKIDSTNITVQVLLKAKKQLPKPLSVNQTIAVQRSFFWVDVNYLTLSHHSIYRNLGSNS